MQPWLYAFLVSLGLCYLATPLVRAVALRVGAVDRPSPRKVHTRPVPRLGGLAIYMAFATTALAFGGFGSASSWGILAGGSAAVILGMVDDLRHLSAGRKFLGQILAALVAVALGVRIEFLSNPFDGMILLGWLAVPLTVFWLVTLTNAINLVDGLDGLAAGISCIASASLLLVALRAGQANVAVVSAALTGASLGFLRHNFNPARIFMGDAGTMFLGFTLAAIAVEGTLKSAAAIALLVPLLIMGLPIADISYAVLRRFRQGRPIYEADRQHLHHLLLELGMTQRQAVVFLYAVSALLGLAAVLIAGVRGMYLALAPLAVALAFAMVTFQAGKRRPGHPE